MSASDHKKGFWEKLVETLKRWFKPLGDWPVSQEIGSFLGDVYRHYKLDLVASSAVQTGQGLRGDYQKAPSRLKLWLKLAILASIVMLIVAVLYHAYYNPTVSRLLYLPMPADAVRVKQMDLVDVAGGGGQTQQSATVTLASRIVGQVTQVHVNLGDIVTTDSVLYECDPRVVQSALISAQQNVAMTESAAKLAKKQYDGNQMMKAQGLASDADLLTSASALATALANQAVAQETLVNAEMDLANATVKSPVNGIVLERLINPSERVVTNETVMELGDLQNIYFLAQIAEDKISSVVTGLKAEVVFPAFPGEVFPGDVFFIDPKTNPTTRAFTAYIKIANPGLKLKPGLSGFARLTNRRHVLAIPDTALINPVGENASVFVITSDSHAILRPVRFGMITQGWTEIDDGLKDGDIVVTVGPLYLANGDKVHYVLKED
jgi:RND family efflux transporter MFP subunit